ncbi:MAG: PAS domain-containing protein, partial [Polaromonas sp.]|nr:PAS domain-containing protein [Polaromonas sp.]
MPEQAPPDDNLTVGERPAGATALAWGPLGLVNDGIVLLDAGGYITDANARALELLQCTLASVSGRDVWEVIPEEIAEAHERATDKALQASPRHAFVAHQKFEDRWVEYTFRRQALGYVVNLSDV